MGRLFVCFILLVQALVFAFAGAQHGANLDKDGRVDRPNAAGAAYTEVATPQGRGAPIREPGSDLVDDAMAELRKIHHPSHHRKRKPRGIIGTVLYYALKAAPSFRISAPPAESSTTTISGPLLQAVRFLEESSQKNNSDALYLLAEMNFYGNYSHPRNFEASFDYYHKLAQLNGNSSASHMVGFMYSTGVGGAVERDQARSLLYHTFAANSGHTKSEMTVAYRYHAGIGTPKNCETAVKYYKRVADKAVAWYRSGPPGGMSWFQEAYRIADETGGVFGEGASVSSAGVNAVKGHPNSGAHASIDDIIEYWDLMSQKGDFKASFNLGRIYYEGQRGLNQDFKLAREYFYAVTQRFWRKGRVVENPKPGLDKTAAKAAGYIGRMHLRGDGVEQNFDRAKIWFDQGILFGDAQSQYGLGLILLHGLGVPQNVARAAELFKSAADQDFAPAQVQIGALYLDQGHADDIGNANHFFEMAARYGNFEAYYYLAEMNLAGIGREKSCSSAASFYKSVAERAEPVVSAWAEANAAYEDGDLELAFLEYLGAAEQGYEKAQNNVAFMLDPEQSRLPLPELLGRKKEKSYLLENPSLALIYWTRSSRQGNIDSLVKMGDYYLQGIGTDSDVEKAVQCYTGASEYHQSAQALYNLGWMHENGVGLNQDFHLAKRYYDSALETNEEAYLPVTLSLLKLRARSAWNTFTHGRINSIRDEPAPKKDWSLSEWIANFVQDDLFLYDDAAYDDLYDGAMPGGDSDVAGDVDDGIIESIIIVGLAAALVFLVMYRQQRQQAARRAEEHAARRQQQRHQQRHQHQQQHQQQQQQHEEQGGQVAEPQGFPQAGNPDFGQWAAGGVGH